MKDQLLFALKYFSLSQLRINVPNSHCLRIYYLYWELSNANPKRDLHTGSLMKRAKNATKI